MTDAREIAEWLIAKIRENGERRTYQSRVVREIREQFGEEWSYKNHNGNWAIDKRVLAEFGPLKDEFVVWNRGNQSWRVLTQEQLDLEREREERRAAARAYRAEMKAAFEAERAASGES